MVKFFLRIFPPEAITALGYISFFVVLIFGEKGVISNDIKRILALFIILMFSFLHKVRRDVGKMTIYKTINASKRYILLWRGVLFLAILFFLFFL